MMETLIPMMGEMEHEMKRLVGVVQEEIPLLRIPVLKFEEMVK